MRKVIYFCLIFMFLGNVLYSQKSQSVKMFYNAIKDGNLEKIDLYLYEIDINYDENNSEVLTPLMVAIEANKLDIVKYLVAKGADVNKPNSVARNEVVARHTSSERVATVNVPTYPLLIAINKQNKEIIDFLLNNGAKYTQFISNVQATNNPEIIKLFINKGAKFNFSSKDLEDAVWSNDFSKVNFYLSAGVKASAKSIVMATEKKNRKMIDLLLSSGGASINDNAHWPRNHQMVDNERILCPVCMAVILGDYDLLKWLVEEKNASVNKQCKLNSGAGMSSKTFTLINLSQDNWHVRRKDTKITEYLALAPAIEKKKQEELKRKKEQELQKQNEIKKQKEEEQKTLFNKFIIEGDSLFVINNYNSAIEAYIKANNILSNEKIIDKISKSYFIIKDYKNSILWYNRLVKISFLSDEILENRGYAYIKTGDFLLAEQDLKLLSKRAKSNDLKRKSNYLFAIYYCETNDFKKSIKSLEKSIKLGIPVEEIIKSDEFKKMSDDQKFKNMLKKHGK